MLVRGSLHVAEKDLAGGDGRSRIILDLIPVSRHMEGTVKTMPVLVGGLATFGVDAGIIDAPGYIVARIVRDAEGRITGLELEPV